MRCQGVVSALCSADGLVPRQRVVGLLRNACEAEQDLVELSPPEREQAVLQYASWGPQGSQLAYVCDGDIYYQPGVSSGALRLTTAGRQQHVVNGLSDWTYEEEVLLTYVAHWWSVDGARLAYLSINNSATPAGSSIPSVSLLVVNLYGPAHTLEMMPPDSLRARYCFPLIYSGSADAKSPGVGTETTGMLQSYKNRKQLQDSRHHLGCYDSCVNISLPCVFHSFHYIPMHHVLHGLSGDSYISMVSWISSTRLAVRWLNRAQNQSVLCVCEATTGACSEVSGPQSFSMVVHTGPPLQYTADVPLFSADGSVFYAVLPAKQGARGEFQHIAGSSAQLLSSLLFISVPPVTQPAIPSLPPRFLTSGSWDVTSLCALDEEAGKIYFLSAEESRQSRHLYSVDLDGVFQRRCISCSLMDGCRFLKAEFSPNQTHFILYCLGYVVLEDNSPLSKALEDKRLPETLFRTLPADNHDLHLKLSLPQGYETHLHPLLVIVDGVPGSQSVTEEFALDWPQVLSGTHNVALAWVDGRSGVGRGQKSSTVDPRKLGSAFGGYLTLKMLASTDKLFQCTAAVAPITDFRLYSAAFSERYLGLPAKEEHAYSTASLLEEVNKLKDERFLILHGTADARVHFQHSAELLSRLVKVEANYSLQLYPDEGHVLRAPHSIQHFQRTVVNYLQSCLKHSILLDPVEDDEEEDD
ncbi:Inactive dipeptidyl peptidase 10 [Liparis tanakae]|uniref:Inactive dipeptidyl peptidase 10 n=1 Tax=Liparis tanakae TaxID=230148 RepID=A0A4Z2GUD6_9TELE|nr:Inactive dipeptidyl peptidase 10 [Liparis tanakae]